MADAFFCRPIEFAVHSASQNTAQNPAINLNNDRLGRTWQLTADGYMIADLGSAQLVDTISLLATSAVAGETVRIRSSNTIGNLSGAAPTGPFLTDVTVNAQASAEASKRLHRSCLATFVAVTARYWRVDVNMNSPSFTAGRLVIGKSMTTADNVDYGWSFEVFDYGSNEVSRLGIDDTLIGAKVLAYQWKWSWFTEAEARGPLLDLMAYAGTTRPVLFCFDPDAADLHNAIAYGSILQSVKTINYAKDTYEAEFQLRSKLILNL